jgi:hypothetical protein
VRIFVTASWNPWEWREASCTVRIFVVPISPVPDMFRADFIGAQLDPAKTGD